MSDILANRSLSPGNFFSTARKHTEIRSKDEKSIKFNEPWRKNLSEIIGKRKINDKEK
jgi:hypothetical protein